MSTVAFCLLTYRPDHPSGIERSIAALVEGVRQLGHTPLVVAAGPAESTDASEPGMVRLETVQLTRPALNDHVLAALSEPEPVAAEMRALLGKHNVNLVCWADTLWGLGFLSPAPAWVKTALMVHKVRPNSEQRWHQALQHADVVCPASSYLATEGKQAGLDTSNWVTVPNALLAPGRPVSAPEREQLRRSAPVRIVTRVEPAKGIAEFVEAMPTDWHRPIELVLAEADFEFWPGMQRDVLAACQAAARRRPEIVQIRPALGWREVPPYLSQAAATVIPSTEAETFCHTAAEALSVGTPVVTFDIGNVPVMAGPAGRAAPLTAGPEALWEVLTTLLENVETYHAASRAAPSQVANFSPTSAARTLLEAARLF